METIDPSCAEHDLVSVMPLVAPATAIAVAEQVPVHVDRAAITPPQAHHAFSEETTSLSSATAVAVAEPVQARAESVPTATSATVVPFPARSKIENGAASLPLQPPIVPCGEHVPEFTRGVLARVVQDIMQLKNVPLEPDGVTAVATTVFDAMTLAQTYQFALGDRNVLVKVANLVTDYLDGIAAQRLLYVLAALESRQPDDPWVIAATTALCKAIHATQDPTKTMVWPEPLDAIIGHYRESEKFMQENGEAVRAPAPSSANRLARRPAKASGRNRRRRRS